MGLIFFTMFLSLLKPQIFPFLLLIRFLFISYSFPLQFLFVSYSSLIDFLFNSYSCPLHLFFISFSFSFMSYLFPFHFHSFLFISFDLRNLPKIQKVRIWFFINLLLKNYSFQTPNQLGRGVPHGAQKKWLIKEVVNKVLGLDGSSFPIQFLVIVYWFPIHSLLISSSILIYFLFNSYSF